MAGPASALSLVQPCALPSCAAPATGICGRCRLPDAVYCCAAHQRKSYPAHRASCKLAAAARRAGVPLAFLGDAELAAALAADARPLAPHPDPALFTGLAISVSDFACANCTVDLLPAPWLLPAVCGGCRAVAYCSDECLSAHFPQHAPDCLARISGRLARGDVHAGDASAAHVIRGAPPSPEKLRARAARRGRGPLRRRHRAHDARVGGARRGGGRADR